MFIPESFGDASSKNISEAITTQTDLYVDDLFCLTESENVKKLVFGFNRFFCDVERYWEDENEPMSSIGQGVYYQKFLDGSQIKRIDKKNDIKQIYDGHHEQLKAISENLVLTYGNCLIVDCHSFNNSENTPDICIGLNNNDTDIDDENLNLLINYFENNGYSVEINNPYSGSIYPKCYKNEKLKTVMVEINKRCYLNPDFTKNFEKYKKLKTTLKNFKNEL